MALPMLHWTQGGPGQDIGWSLLKAQLYSQCPSRLLDAVGKSCQLAVPQQRCQTEAWWLLHCCQQIVLWDLHWV